MMGHKICIETVLMMGHKICFYEEIWIIIPKLSLLLLLTWSTAFIHQVKSLKFTKKVTLEASVEKKKKDVHSRSAISEQNCTEITNAVYNVQQLSVANGVVLLFYVHRKHLRSCRDGQLI